MLGGIMLEKSDLKRGMQVRNRVSGHIGEVRDPTACTEKCVSIRKRVLSGKNKGRWSYDIWDVANIERVN